MMTFQSTFPRGERRWNGSISRPGPGISIHVPSWGTTITYLNTLFCKWHFNPRSLVGNDWDIQLFRSCTAISIHVPSWGTTENKKEIEDGKEFQSTFPRGERPPESSFSSCIIRYFNPRSLVGNDDVQRRFITSSSEVFQSTFPRGERRAVGGRIKIRRKHFNPRSLVGNDRNVPRHHERIWISIHVPSWGTTAVRYQ